MNANQCSFCGRKRNEVQMLVSGQNGFICENCIEQAHAIVKDSVNHSTDAVDIVDSMEALKKPKEIKEQKEATEMTQTVLLGTTKIKDMPFRIIDGDRGSHWCSSRLDSPGLMPSRRRYELPP